MRMKKMKKLTALLLALAMVLSLAACGDTSGNPSAAPSDEGSQAPAESTAPPVGGSELEELGSGCRDTVRRLAEEV